ncbi:MAG: FAD:protein FMN transferase [Opitutus sp.]
MPLVTQTFRTQDPVSVGAPGVLRRLEFHAMGTPCGIQYVCDDEARAQVFARAAQSWVEAFEAKYSRYRDDSLISRINAAAGREWVPVDPDMEQLLRLCDTLHFVTQGILDPTALPLLRLWNYKIDHPVLPTEAEVVAGKALVGWSKVQRAPGKIFLPQVGMALDFGGFGKEYAVDIVAQIAVDHGITNVLVDFGHDLRALGKPPGRPAWHIGLENPKQPGVSAGSVALTGSRGIASSGDYLRRFTFGGKRYGHIVDPRTGRPVANGCVQVTAISGTCLHAGVLSTTAFVLGVTKGIEFIQSFPGAEGMIMTDDARAQTRGFFNHVAAA